MKNLFFSKIMILLNILVLHIYSIDIALIPVLTDITTDNYEISNNILSIKSDGEYKISGSCSECQISIKKGLSVSITLRTFSYTIQSFLEVNSVPSSAIYMFVNYYHSISAPQ